MSKRLTKEEFVDKARMTHGDNYDYSDVIYENSHKRVIIKCRLHDLFSQKPYQHIAGAGCPECGKNRRAFKNSNKHIDGNKTKEFIRRSKILNGDKYDYSETKFTRHGDKINIICKKHGLFTQVASCHLKGSGCRKCHRDYRRRFMVEKISRKKTKNDWINEFNNKHNNAYDYSLLPEKFQAKDKIKIICRKHDMIFETIAKTHRTGTYCRQCSIDKNKGKRRQSELYVWSHSKWQKMGEQSKKFSSFKVYLLELYNNEERFFKIGKTYQSTKARFYKKIMPYEWRVLKIIQSDQDGIFISKLEKMLQNKNKKYKYNPKIEFDGDTECFSFIEDGLFNMHNDYPKSLNLKDNEN